MAAGVVEQEREQDDLAVEIILNYKKLGAAKRKRVDTLLGLLVKSDDCDEQREIAMAIAEIMMPKKIGICDHLGTVANLDEGIGDDIKEAAHAYKKKIGKAIRDRREQLGMTQEQLAKSAGLLQSHVCRLEIGMHAPTKNTIERLAKALGVRASDLDILDSD